MEEQAHVAQDVEPTLLPALWADDDGMAPPMSPTLQPPPPPLSTQDVAVEPLLELVEEKVLAVFNDATGRDLKRWVLGTGAMNHMTRSGVAFSDLDTGIIGTVRFEDGSNVKIEGRGTILLTCKNGEHRAFTNVYFIPRLTANIIGVGLLDEISYQVLVEDGVMRIRGEERRLLAKIHRSPSRLYVLDINLACAITCRRFNCR